jgi:hypothetical protein
MRLARAAARNLDACIGIADIDHLEVRLVDVEAVVGAGDTAELNVL